MMALWLPLACQCLHLTECRCLLAQMQRAASKIEQHFHVSVAGMLDGPAVLTLPSLAADVAATAEAAGALLTSLGWGYTQGVVDATIGGDAAFAIGSGAGAPQVCAIVTGRAAGTQVCAMKGL